VAILVVVVQRVIATDVLEFDMNNKIFNAVEDLYNHNNVGVNIVCKMFNTEELERINNVFIINKEHFYPLEFGGVTRWDLTENDFSRYPALDKGRRGFKLIIDTISTLTELNPVYREKFCILFYPEGSVGVKPHRDTRHSVNCVSIFVFSGNNSFFATKDSACKHVTEFFTEPGDAIVMRGPRKIKDDISCPIHYVSQVVRPRYVMVCRHINTEGLKSSPSILVT